MWPFHDLYGQPSRIFQGQWKRLLWNIHLLVPSAIHADDLTILAPSPVLIGKRLPNVNHLQNLMDYISMQPKPNRSAFGDH